MVMGDPYLYYMSINEATAGKIPDLILGPSKVKQINKRTTSSDTHQNLVPPILLTLLLLKKVFLNISFMTTHGVYS